MEGSQLLASQRAVLTVAACNAVPGLSGEIEAF